MTVNPADGFVRGALYGTDAMRAAFGETAWLQRMRDVEAALARAQARLGIVPAEAAAAITAAALANATVPKITCPIRRRAHVLPLDCLNEGFDLMERGESIRSVAVY